MAPKRSTSTTQEEINKIEEEKTELTLNTTGKSDRQKDMNQRKEKDRKTDNNH